MRMIKSIYISIILFLFLFLCAFELLAFQNESSIVKIEGNDIYINWGESDGIKPGMKFTAYRKMSMENPSTGEKIEIERESVGNIIVTETFPEYSIGKVISKQIEPKVGDYLELVINSESNESEISQFGEGEKKASILSINGGKVEISVGGVDGVQEGLLFDVVKEMILKHPATGEYLERKKYLIGKVSVENIREKSSLCRVLSGWEDIKKGDEVVLSERQRSDMGIDIIEKGKKQYSEPMQISKLSEKEPEKLPITQEKEKPVEKQYFGKVSKINNKTKTVLFSWEKEFDKNAISPGRDIGIYRKEKVLHPITKVEIASPEILIADGNFSRTVGSNGELKLKNLHTRIKNGDLVGIIEKKPSEVSVPKRTVEKKTDLKTDAETLTKEFINIQDDINRLKSLSNRITNIEKSLYEQKKLTDELKKDINEVKDKLNLLLGSAETALIPSQTTMELYGAHPEKAKSFRIKYTDDIDVKFQFQNQTLLVSLDVDSAKVKGEISAIEKTEAPVEVKKEVSDTSKVEEAFKLSELLGETTKKAKPIYEKYLYHILGGIGGLIFLIIVIKLLKGKGKKKKAGKKEEFEIEEGEEIEEELEEIEEGEENV